MNGGGIRGGKIYAPGTAITRRDCWRSCRSTIGW